ncbi:MAG: tyrosine-type recombinase/integrase [Candidatus Dependentiae bacterium]|nr:tyrosine-type recombinase/integrase [Candidatus Dependentiae bacterium]
MVCEPLRPYIAPFLEQLRVSKGISENTRRSYQSDLNGLFEFWKKRELTLQKTVPLDDAIKRYRGHLTTQKILPSSIARKISCFNSFTQFLAQRGIIEPTSFLRPAVVLANPKTISQKELAYLLDELEAKKLPTPLPYRDRCILELLYATGVRCSELSDLRIGSINLTEKSLVVRGKKSSVRTIYFGDRTVQHLQRYLKRERPTVERSDEYLFLNYRREPLTSRSIQRICSMFAAFLGRERELTPQILRHSFAIHLLEGGADIATVQHLLGHAVRISTERYIR